MYFDMTCVDHEPFIIRFIYQNFQQRPFFVTYVVSVIGSFHYITLTSVFS